jgi:hypothetical protein
MVITIIPVNCLRSLWLDSMDTVMLEIVTVFYIGNGLNDMIINSDCLYSMRFGLPLITFMKQSC